MIIVLVRVAACVIESSTVVSTKAIAEHSLIIGFPFSEQVSQSGLYTGASPCGCLLPNTSDNALLVGACSCYHNFPI